VLPKLVWVNWALELQCIHWGALERKLVELVLLQQGLTD
jgi:hypothetical protein